MLNAAHGPGRLAFTLVELLVSMAVFILLMLILLGAINGLGGVIQRSTSKVQEFRDARTAFETITRRLSEATLNTYWGYNNPAAPTTYLRQSELRFISGPSLSGSYSSTPPRPTHSMFFQAPLGYVSNTTSYGDLPNLLNTWGYYIEFNSDINAGMRPGFITTAMIPARYRYRLIELREPSDQLSVYQYTTGISASGTLNCTLYNSKSANGWSWFTTPLAVPTDRRVLAQNIVALVLLPMLSQEDDSTGTALCPAYTYDSSMTDANNDATVSNSTLNWKHQLPPVVQVTMVAVDETTFQRLQSGTTPPPVLVSGSIGNLFQAPGSNIYTNTSSQAGYSKDLATLEATLQASRLNYRVFSTNVIIKGAKWSRSETQ